jgi:hypothetical protein
MADTIPEPTRSVFAIRFDIIDSTCNLDLIATDLDIDCANAGLIVKRMEAEIGCLRDLLAELVERVE